MNEPLNFDNWRVRASSAGKLMIKPRGKGNKEKLSDLDDLFKSECIKLSQAKEGTKTFSNISTKIEKIQSEINELRSKSDEVQLSDTTITYLIEQYTSARYGIKKEIAGKYLDSGKAREDDSIALLSELHDEFYKKNTSQRRYDEFTEGDCDILYPVQAPEMVRDVKSCWDAFTFEPHSLEDEIENKIYEWQGVVYGHQYGVSKFFLDYCLVNMPDEIVKDELKRILYKFGTSKEDSEEYQDACREFVKTTRFDHIPMNERVITFFFNCDENKYAELCERVKVCRKWLNDFSIKRWEKANGKKWIPKGSEDIKVKEQSVAAVTIEVRQEPKIEVKQVTEPKIEQVKPEPKIEPVKQVIEPKIETVKQVIEPKIEPTISEIQNIPDESYDNIPDAIYEDQCEDCLSVNLVIKGEFYICSDCGYTNEPPAPEVTVSTTPEPVSPTQSQSPTPAQSKFAEKFKEIDEISDPNELIDFYTENAVLLSDKELFAYLDEKRKSFLPKEQPKQSSVPSQKQSPQPPQPKPSSPQQPVQKIPVAQFQQSEQKENTEEDIAKLAEIRESLKKCEKPKDVQNLYVSNRILIDRNRDLRSEMEALGKKLSDAQIAKNREAIKNEMNINPSKL